MDVFKKLEALQNVEAFEQDMAEVKSLEKMQQLLSRHGVEVTSEEIDALAAYAAKSTGEELNVDALDDVAGGFMVPWGVNRAVAKLLLWLIKK